MRHTVCTKFLTQTSAFLNVILEDGQKSRTQMDRNSNTLEKRIKTDLLWSIYMSGWSVKGIYIIGHLVYFCWEFMELVGWWIELQNGALVLPFHKTSNWNIASEINTRDYCHSALSSPTQNGISLIDDFLLHSVFLISCDRFYQCTV